MNKDHNLLLEGITGSTAYGLATKDSDVDTHGIFAAPTSEILSLQPVQETVTTNKPDATYHEVGKFMRLAMKGNPTILELLFLEGYTKTSKHGRMLIDNRHLFLSKVIYKSYGGYAIHQARRLNARQDSFSSETKNRYAKHARHCFRLLQQGQELLETGDLTVRVKNRDEIFAIGEMPVSDLVDAFEEKFAAFDKIKTNLPDKPDIKRLNSLLLKIRRSDVF